MTGLYKSAFNRVTSKTALNPAGDLRYFLVRCAVCDVAAVVFLVVLQFVYENDRQRTRHS